MCSWQTFFPSFSFLFDFATFSALQVNFGILMVFCKFICRLFADSNWLLFDDCDRSQTKSDKNKSKTNHIFHRDANTVCWNKTKKKLTFVKWLLGWWKVGRPPNNSVINKRDRSYCPIRALSFWSSNTIEIIFFGNFHNQNHGFVLDSNAKTIIDLFSNEK